MTVLVLVRHAKTRHQLNLSLFQCFHTVQIIKSVYFLQRLVRSFTFGDVSTFICDDMDLGYVCNYCPIRGVTAI